MWPVLSLGGIIILDLAKSDTKAFVNLELYWHFVKLYFCMSQYNMMEVPFICNSGVANCYLHVKCYYDVCGYFSFARVIQKFAEVDWKWYLMLYSFVSCCSLLQRCPGCL